VSLGSFGQFWYVSFIIICSQIICSPPLVVKRIETFVKMRYISGSIIISHIYIGINWNVDVDTNTCRGNRPAQFHLLGQYIFILHFDIDAIRFGKTIKHRWCAYLTSHIWYIYIFMYRIFWNIYVDNRRSWIIIYSVFSVNWTSWCHLNLIALKRCTNQVYSSLGEWGVKDECVSFKKKFFLAGMIAPQQFGSMRNILESFARKIS
jgi:hypothetical protein